MDLSDIASEVISSLFRLEDDIHPVYGTATPQLVCNCFCIVEEDISL